MSAVEAASTRATRTAGATERALVCLFIDLPYW